MEGYENGYANSGTEHVMTELSGGKRIQSVGLGAMQHGISMGRMWMRCISGSALQPRHRETGRKGIQKSCSHGKNFGEITHGSRTFSQRMIYEFWRSIDGVSDYETMKATLEKDL